MPRLQLVAIDDRTAGLLEPDPARFEAEHGARLGTDEAVLTHLRWVVGLMLEIGAPAPWGGYIALDEVTGEIVGTCGFKGEPDGEGMVEIGYSTFAPSEGKGVATEMAGRLVEMATGKGGAQVVRAHTLPENNASGRVLTKNGFARLGEVIDPEDGLVWRWERPAREGMG